MDFGAGNQNRTDDPIIAKQFRTVSAANVGLHYHDVLYRLSRGEAETKNPPLLRWILELVIRIELMTSSLPMTCSTD